jgi:hypothetical protein
MSSMTRIIRTTAYRSLVVGALGATMIFGQASAAESALPVHPCTPELHRLLQEWNEAGYQVPNKPTAPIVYGRNGRVSSGPEVTYMVSQIRQAIIDCQHGDVAAVQQHVALVSEKLHRQS